MVKSIPDICKLKIAPRILGFDDAPFPCKPRQPGSEVHAVGIVTTSDRFEGMIYCGGVLQDGLNAGDCLAQAIKDSKFHDQIHAVFIDGVTMGGLNVIDIAELAKIIQRPVVSVMRHQPNLERMLSAISRLPNANERTAKLTAAGPIHQINNWVFQFRCPDVTEDSLQQDGVTPEHVATLLDQCTPSGGQKIPECLRMAHLIGAAIKTGQSSSSA